jgi:hypothetical protein
MVSLCNIHYGTIYNDMFRPYKWAITCRCILYCNVYYIEIPSVNCCVSTASICMYIHIIHCNIINLAQRRWHTSRAKLEWMNFLCFRFLFLELFLFPYLVYLLISNRIISSDAQLPKHQYRLPHSQTYFSRPKLWVTTTNTTRQRSLPILRMYLHTNWKKILLWIM